MGALDFELPAELRTRLDQVSALPPLFPYNFLSAIQPRQRGIQGTDQILAAVARGVRVALRVLVIEAVLGGQNDAIAHTRFRHKFAQPGLGGALRVDVRRLGDIPPGCQVGVEHRACGLPIAAPTVLGAKGHGTQGQARDAQTGTAKQVVCGGLHRVSQVLAEIETH